MKIEVDKSIKISVCLFQSTNGSQPEQIERQSEIVALFLQKTRDN